MSSSKTQPLVVMLSVYLYRWLLHLGPKEFLQDYEELMLLDFRQQCRETYMQRGASGVLCSWPSMFARAIVDMGVERIAETRRKKEVRSASQSQPPLRPPTPKDFEEYMTWRIRWYVIIAITIGYVLSLIAGLIGFWVTKDVHYLLFIAPTTLIPFLRYLVPMDKKQYELQMAKINAKKPPHETKDSDV